MYFSADISMGINCFMMITCEKGKIGSSLVAGEHNFFFRIPYMLLKNSFYNFIAYNRDTANQVIRLFIVSCKLYPCKITSSPAADMTYIIVGLYVGRIQIKFRKNSGSLPSVCG